MTTLQHRPVAPGPYQSRRRGGLRGRLFVMVVLVALLLPLLVAVRIVQVAERDARPQVDAIIVLGAAASGGHPGQVLQARLDHARQLYADGVAPVIVTAGGTGEGQPRSEADAGAAWLVDHGVPAAAVIAVGSGGDTLTSLQAVKDGSADYDWTSVLLVSDPWHLYRARAMAADVGLPVVATSPVSSGPNVTSRNRIVFNVIRETAAFITYRAGTVARAVR